MDWRTKMAMIKQNSAFAYEDGNRKDDNMTEAQRYLNRLQFEEFNRKIAAANNLALPDIHPPRSKSSHSANSSNSNHPQTQFVQIFRDGEIDYLKVTDPDADLEQLKQLHFSNLDCPLYRA